MTTKLEAPLKREVEIDGVAYTLTIAPDGMALVLKGRRKGFELKWSDLVSGDAALTTALNASLTARLTAQRSTPQVTRRPVAARQAAPPRAAAPPPKTRKRARK